MPVITLPDGSHKRFDRPVTVAEVAASIGPGLAKAALAGRVDARLVDTAYLIERDAAVSIVTDKDPAALGVIRHSTAHLLAQAVQAIYPAAQNLILAARALGLGTTFTTFHHVADATIREVLAIPPDVRIGCVIPVGWPDREFGPVNRKPVESFVHRDRW